MTELRGAAACLSLHVHRIPPFAGIGEVRMFTDNSIPFYRDDVVAQFLSIDELDELAWDFFLAVSTDG